MHPAFDVERRPHLSVLSLWIELEASFPNTPSEFFVPDNPGISDETLEAQFKKVQHDYITASIHFYQKRLAYGECLAKIARRKAAKKRRTNAALSTFFRLPDEMISSIFQFTGRAILLSHVCHRWRAIAIHTPALWCHFTKGMVDPQAMTFLERSRNQPLIIDHIDIGRFVTIPHRVKSLNLMLEDALDIKRIPNVPAPFLEHMSLRATKYRDIELFNISLFANQAPRLKKVKLYRFTLMKFPVQSITELSLRCCTLPEAGTTIHFLQSIPGLLHLTLLDNFFHGDTTLMFDCQLPSLTKLSVSEYHSGPKNIKIFAPNLERLYLAPSPFLRYPLVHPVPSLKQLWLNTEGFMEDEFKRIHKQLQEVQVLVTISRDYNALVETLSVLFEPDGDNNFLLPSLCKLLVNQSACDPSQLSDIQRLVDVRKVTVSFIKGRLHSRSIHTLKDFHEFFCSPLETLVQTF